MFLLTINRIISEDINVCIIIWYIYIYIYKMTTYMVYIYDISK